jgi:hypothetical protein
MIQAIDGFRRFLSVALVQWGRFVYQTLIETIEVVIFLFLFLLPRPSMLNQIPYLQPKKKTGKCKQKKLNA